MCTGPEISTIISSTCQGSSTFRMSVTITSLVVTWFLGCTAGVLSIVHYKNLKPSQKDQSYIPITTNTRIVAAISLWVCIRKHPVAVVHSTQKISLTLVIIITVTSPHRTWSALSTSQIYIS